MHLASHHPPLSPSPLKPIPYFTTHSLFCLLPHTLHLLHRHSHTFTLTSFHPYLFIFFISHFFISFFFSIRNVVMQADPDFSRTVLVTTKLDTKLPQFSEADDLEDFLRYVYPNSLISLHYNILIF